MPLPLTSNLVFMDIQSEQPKGNCQQIAAEALPLGLSFMSSMPKSGRLNRKARRKLKNECFNHMMTNYKPSEFVIPSWLLWMVIRSVLWWLAEKIIQRLWEVEE